jgi:DNA gyrase subunit B
VQDPPEGRAHGKEDNFAFAGGVQGFVEFINKGKKVLHPNIFHAMGDRQSDQAPTSASKWPCSGTSGYNEQVLCFTNNIPQRDGGTHLTGLRAAMTRVINKYIDDKRAGQEGQGRDHRRRHARRPGLRAERQGARAQVQQPDQGQAGVSEVRGPVEDIVSKLLTDYLLENPATPRSSAARSSKPPAPAKPPARPAR